MSLVNESCLMYTHDTHITDICILPPPHSLCTRYISCQNNVYVIYILPHTLHMLCILAHTEHMIYILPHTLHMLYIPAHTVHIIQTTTKHFTYDIRILPPTVCVMYVYYAHHTVYMIYILAHTVYMIYVSHESCHMRHVT